MTSTVLRSNELDEIDAELAEIRQELATTTDGFEDWLRAERTRELAKGDGFNFVDCKLLDASSPNRPGPYEFAADGTVVVSSPSKGLNGFSHSIQLLADGHTLTDSNPTEQQSNGQQSNGQQSNGQQSNGQQSNGRSFIGEDRGSQDRVLSRRA